MSRLSEVIGYFGRVFSKEKQSKYPSNTNIKIMHGINRISIVMFAIALLVIIYRFLFR